MREIDVAESPHKGQRGLRRLFKAFLYSLSGLALAFRHESAFRQEVALAAVLIPLACVIDVTGVERVLLVCSVILVLVVELLNSSVEAAIDRIGFDTHRLSKRAKDLGSAAVLVSLAGLCFVWLVLAGPAMVDAMRSVIGSARAADLVPCRVVDENPVMREMACELGNAASGDRYRFVARFSGSHDDTSVSIALRIDDLPVQCDPGSTTSRFAEDGDVSLDCTFTVARERPRTVTARIRWHHAWYVDAMLEPR